MLQTYIREMSPRDTGLMEMIDDKNNSKINQALLLLGYKRLFVTVLAENNFGGGQEARVQDITDFGKASLAFIKE